MELRDLYQEIVLDHYRKPQNYKPLEDADHSAEGHNPLCGDRVTIYLDIEDGVVREASFQGAGCAISTASASLMTEAVKGKTVGEVEKLFAAFRRLVTGKEETPDDAEVDLGKLEALGGVREIPVRLKCATLAWHTLHSALHEDDEAPVSTE